MTEPYYKQHWVEIDADRHSAYDQILAFHPALEPMLRPLDLRPGLRVLDVGSGPGHTTLELARRVAPGGSVTGVDINAEFVARSSARARDGKLDATFVHSAFPPLPFPDNSFDRVWCKNVLEYVDSAADTVAEMVRVAAPGAVVVAVDSDWDMIVLETTPDSRERNDRILAASKAIAIKEPRIGRQLHGLFRRAGLDQINVEIFAGADTAGRSLPMLKASFARYARDSGKIAAPELERWLADVDSAVREGSYFFVLPQFVARGIKK
ncbi:MAG: methyltransferase domain-containing protein [Candidatus Binatus sp.]|uniref:methyltransferase domain-containing protein n=1 Tax=Candidatus Binatus sp. TaxID=2811406 RepID=UPI0027280F56|nr:methyltransferase domain-containing protein [Candidatus Binatus sp.]MDO8432273.1 methyltransferase domain-containing protein [Candidatus Binatus sp.]